MENERYLQNILDYIARGLQNTSDCSPQLLLLLVLLEEVYETGNAIPLLTEKKATIQSVIRFVRYILFSYSGSVAGITSSVTSILRSVSVVIIFVFSNNRMKIL